MAEFSSMPLVAYRLNELGWLQFDRLCSLLLEVEGGLGAVGWRGRSDTERIATVVGPVVLRDQRLRGPVTVAVIWVRDDRGEGVRLAELAERTAALLIDPSGRGDEVVVFTNLDARGAMTVLRGYAFAKRRRLLVLDAREIATCLDRSAGDGQDGDRADAFAFADDRWLGGA